MDRDRQQGSYSSPAAAAAAAAGRQEQEDQQAAAPLPLLSGLYDSAEQWLVAEVLPGLARQHHLLGLWQLLSKWQRSDRLQEVRHLLDAALLKQWQEQQKQCQEHQKQCQEQQKHWQEQQGLCKCTCDAVRLCCLTRC